MRAALEAAWLVAREGSREIPARTAPRPLQPLLGHARLTTAALETIRKVLDDDAEFRERVASAVTEESVGRAGWLFLRRPDGWADELATLASAEAEGEEADRAEREERSLARRLRGTEDALRRTEQALEDTRAQVARAADELARERQVRRRAEEAAAEVETLRMRLADAEEELNRLRHATTSPPPPPPPPSAAHPSPAPRNRREGRPRRRPTPLPPAVLDDSPEAADHLVRVPGVLVLVDGYNASLAYRPDLPIPELRQRLIDALGELAARTGADVHVVFDGAELAGDGPTSRSGGRRLAARVRFSPPDVEADDVILGMVDEAPPSRPVVVASDDRRVQDGARDRGANVISTGQLLSALRRER